MKEEFEVEKPKKGNQILHTLKVCKRNVTVEPLLFLFLIPFYMSSLTIQNLNLEKACRVNLNLSVSICDALRNRNRSGYNESDEILVQKVVASAYIWKNVVYGFFPAILLPLLGSWSDRNNIRTVLLILPIIGEVFSSIGFLLCTYFFYELPMEVSVATEVLPTALTGGSNMYLLGVFTYISVITSTKSRTYRIGIIHVLFNLSVTIGIALSGIMYNLVGFYGVFSISLIMYSLAGIYLKCYVAETNNDKNKVLTKLELAKNIFNLKETFSTFKFLFKPHQTNRRSQIAVIAMLAVLVLGPFVGETTVMYLYTRFKFNWNEINFSAFYTYSCVAHLIGNSIALAVFSGYLGLDDGLLGALSSVSKILGGIVYTLAKVPQIFYIGTLLEIFNGTAFVASRSILTKLVTAEELGKVNSIFGIAESLTILVYGPLYTSIYKATLQVFSGAFFVVGVTLTVPPIFLYLWLYKNRHNRKPSPFDEENITTKEKLLNIKM